jgi:selenocysteine-specific elongation factor
VTTGRHIIFGTAGHVDHGKSALVLALTGTDPDRLAEEKAREMTIDLGFAFLALPGVADTVAIVDVPGHEMFIRNMVAGASGVDAALFVVAADEGVMPQTVEHLEVLRQLGIADGVVALTKIDRVADPRLDAVQEETAKLIAGSFLEQAAIVPASATTGEGVEEVRRAMADVAARTEPRASAGPFRLPIDRVFVLKGVGTVVTGSVVSGSATVGDEMECLPGGRRVRIRNIHVHEQPVRHALAGQRAALNLPDVAKDELHRGDVLATPGPFAPSTMMDVRVTLARTLRSPLEQRDRVRLHHGTAEVMGRVVLLEGDEMRAGGSGLAQLRLESPLVAAPGDRFVMRSYSPMTVTGGGTIIDPHPPKRRKARGAAAVAEREELPPAERAMDALSSAGPHGLPVAELALRCSLPADELHSILDDLCKQDRARPGRQAAWFSETAVREMESQIVQCLEALHADTPVHASLPLNAVIEVVAPSAAKRECFRLALDALTEGGVVVRSGDRVRLASHAASWTGEAAAARDEILRRLLDNGLAVPSPEELAPHLSVNPKECLRLLDALAASGDVVRVAPDMFVHAQVVAHATSAVQDYLQRQRTMTIGECRELLGASRKYLLPFLEHLDSAGITTRRGNHRILARRPNG